MPCSNDRFKRDHLTRPWRGRWRRLLAAMIMTFILVAGYAGSVQMTAWAGMLLTRIPSQGVEEAVSSTFDGSAPCCLCKQLAKSMEPLADNGGEPLPADRQGDTLKQIDNALLPAIDLHLLTAMTTRRLRLAQEPRFDQWRMLPDTPPPRC